MVNTFTKLKVKLSLLEYEDRFVPLPLFTSSIALITGFTFIFPILALGTLPFSVFLVYSIFTGDINLVDDTKKVTPKSINLIQEEE
jgi:hypothetical protein|tara:strand:+ start:5825 stop:6082 length:258 start_codon:yes stop_codon:yes gene_type:complete